MIGEAGQYAVVRIEDEHVSGWLCGERQRGDECEDYKCQTVQRSRQARCYTPMSGCW